MDRFDPETGIAEHLGIVYPTEGHPNIMALHVDSSGRLWYRSWGFGLYCYNPADGTYRIYRNDPTNPFSITCNIVHCVVQDKEGWFWIGTRNGGLCIFDPQRELAIPHLTPEIAPIVTVSIGVASVIPSPEWSVASLIQAADRGVYLAKSKDRNRVTVFDPIHLPKT